MRSAPKIRHTLDFAPDDNLWVKKKPLEEIFGLLYDPCAWVHQYVTVTDPKTGQQKAAELSPYYSISYEAIDTESGGDPSLFIVQGIDQTDILTIRMPALGAAYYTYSELIKVKLGPAPDPADLSASLAYEARQLIHTKIIDLPPPHLPIPIFLSAATIQQAAAILFHDRQVHITVCDRSKAYAHMPLSLPLKKLIKNKALLEKYEQQAIDRKYSLINDAERRCVMTALYHLFAAAWPAVVEDSFNYDNGDPDVSFSVWNGDDWDKDSDQTNLKNIRPFKCKDGRPPMTITGLSKFGAAKHNIEFETADVETCEVLVAEYVDQDPHTQAPSITWSDAFSKSYGGG